MPRPKNDKKPRDNSEFYWLYFDNITGKFEPILQRGVWQDSPRQRQQLATGLVRQTKDDAEQLASRLNSSVANICEVIR